MQNQETKEVKALILAFMQWALKSERDFAIERLKELQSTKEDINGENVWYCADRVLYCPREPIFHNEGDWETYICNIDFEPKTMYNALRCAIDNLDGNAVASIKEIAKHIEIKD